MNKKLKYLIFVVAIIVLAGLAYLIVKNNQTKNPTANEKVAVSTAAQQVAQQAQQAAQQAQQKASSTPVYTKEVKAEFMADAEKLTMSIPAALKIQVLERNQDGKVTAYKIIRQDSDIMTKYGN